MSDRTACISVPHVGSDGLNLGSDGLNLAAKTGGHREDQGGQPDSDTEHGEGFLAEPGHSGSPVERPRSGDESFKRTASNGLDDPLCRTEGNLTSRLQHGSSSACESRNVECRRHALRRSAERAWWRSENVRGVPCALTGSHRRPLRDIRRHMARGWGIRTRSTSVFSVTLATLPAGEDHRIIPGYQFIAILRNVLKWRQFPASTLGPIRIRTDPGTMSEVTYK